MNIGYCIGRSRSCSFCGRKFTDTEEEVFVEEDSDEIIICHSGDSVPDIVICIQGWLKSHPGFIFNFEVKKLSEVERYFTWPPELARVR